MYQLYMITDKRNNFGYFRIDCLVIDRKFFI